MPMRAGSPKDEYSIARRRQLGVSVLNQIALGPPAAGPTYWASPKPSIGKKMNGNKIKPRTQMPLFP